MRIIAIIGLMLALAVLVGVAPAAAQGTDMPGRLAHGLLRCGHLKTQGGRLRNMHALSVASSSPRHVTLYRSTIMQSLIIDRNDTGARWGQRFLQSCSCGLV